MKIELRTISEEVIRCLKENGFSSPQTSAALVKLREHDKEVYDKVCNKIVDLIVREQETSDTHEWEYLSSGGLYEAEYRCKKCGLVHIESVDDPGSGRPVIGCAEMQKIYNDEGE